MNLRTITFYAAYNPKRKEIAFGRQFKKELDRCHIPHGHVIVKMKGNYGAVDVTAKEAYYRDAGALRPKE